MLKALDVIDALVVAGRPVSVSELAERVGQPVPTAHRMLRTLLLRDYVSQTDDGLYRITLKLYELGTGTIARIDVATELRPICEALCSQLAETVNLGIRSGEHAVYVTKLESPRSLHLLTQLGLHVPLQTTAMGKALLAFMPRERSAAVIDRIAFQPRTRNTITDRGQLETELERARSRGWAVDDEEFDYGLVCIGAPVYDRTGEVIAAISASGPRERFAPSAWTSIGAAVRGAADRASAQLGYRPRAAPRGA